MSPVPHDPQVRTARAKVAAAARDGRTGPDVDAAKAVLLDKHSERAFEEYIRRVIAAAPPMSAETADRIAALLRPSSDGA